MPGQRAEPAGPGLLAGMRVRKKLIVLHTLFSLVLAGMLMLAVRPGIQRVVDQAEMHEARLAVGLLAARSQAPTAPSLSPLPAGAPVQAALAEVRALMPEGVALDVGVGEELGVNPVALDEARQRPGHPVPARVGADNAAVLVDEQTGRAFVATVRLREVRDAVAGFYLLAGLALLGVYALIALALEVLVLPRAVYRPIARILEADRAVRDGPREREIIDEALIPADELGEIMRSRNQAVLALRRHEQALASTLRQLEAAANDLQRKNHLLETATRNLADADRLASLGIMSAGLAHELNTPLTVVKGLVERLANHPERKLTDADASLLVRVVGRLERLSESLLDFARVRPARTAPVALLAMLDEAWTLVRLDRGSQRVEFLTAGVDPALLVDGDSTRLVQVFVNLLRNAVDAMTTGPLAAEPATITARAEGSQREGRLWVTLTLTDTGPGIHPDMLPRLFEPFASTRLDARGTGLGLAVSHGIIREHEGLLLARNRAEGRGAVFEVVLPAARPHAEQAGAVPSPEGVAPGVTADTVDTSPTGARP